MSATAQRIVAWLRGEFDHEDVASAIEDHFCRLDDEDHSDDGTMDRRGDPLPTWTFAGLEAERDSLQREVERLRALGDAMATSILAVKMRGDRSSWDAAETARSYFLAHVREALSEPTETKASE